MADQIDQEQYFHLKELSVDFIEKRPTSDLELIFKDDAGVKHKSNRFENGVIIRWNIDIYVRTQTGATLTIQRSFLGRGFAEFSVKFKSDEFGDDKSVSLKDSNHRVTVNFLCGRSKSLTDVARVLGSRACTALASKVNMLEGLDKILGILKLAQIASGLAQLNPIANVTVSVVIKVIANFQEISSCHQQFVSLMDDLVSVLPIIHSVLESIEVEGRRALVRSFIEFVKETSEQINKYASQPTWTYLLDNWYNSKQGEVKALREKSTHLIKNIDLAIGVDIKEHLLKKDREQALKRIKPPTRSSFDPDPKNCCMPGTRADLIERLTSFAVSEGTSQRLFFLSGIAGCGKSSVATSVANSLHERGCLSGSFFFQRDDKELRNPTDLLHTMAYSIALRHEPYRKALMDVLQTNPRIEDEAPLIQFNALFKNTISKLPSTTTSDSPSKQAIVSIVIDALDECDDPRSASSYLVEIVGLAPWLRVIVTSRPLDDIEPDLRRAEYATHLNLFTVDASEDILKFTLSYFSPPGLLHRLRSQVTEEEIQALANKSHGLFNWIKTVLLYLASLAWEEAKLKEMRSILSSSSAAGPEKGIDELYLRVLRNVAGNSPDYLDAVKSFVGSIYVTSRNRPLPCKGLHAFIPISDPDILATPEDIDGLRSKLAAVITIDAETEALHVCHPSFLDFVEKQARSQEFWTNPEALDTMMAQRCFNIMKAGLRFNICGLESSHQRNDEILGLVQRISPELQYSAVYWLDHLSLSGGLGKEEKITNAYEFLYHARLFYWLEVLSVISEINAAAQTLRKLVALSKGDPEICETFQDFLRFVLLLRQPMSVSVPHIYISSAIWAEPWSVAMQFLPSGLRVIKNGSPETRPVDAWQLNVGSVVCSVAYSPNGRRIATGSLDGAIRIWDSKSGIPLTDPFKGHLGIVSSVAYSPDGTHISSGSGDCTVRIWDSQTGMPIGEPFKGHTGPVTSIKYSPDADGAHIISGSWDMTVRIWNSQTGTLVREPLQGPTGHITSVAYSPDGTQIVCGSEDTRVWKWKSLTGQPIGNPFEGHKDGVTSVAFSPNGNNIVSGSKDNTLQIWDPQTGSLAFEPLRGHSSWVMSALYSPNGEVIVSGSMDNTFCLWDSQTGKPIRDPLRSHRALITSVAFSSDGRYIISGSFDGTVHIWDSQTEMFRGKTLQGHTDAVKAITYSRDGKCIISGSCDKTIRKWNTKTGLPMSQPLKGHTNDVQSLAYSPAPDETYIVSASWDNTLKIWNAQTGAPIDRPLEGHSKSVLSVAYSPDGKQIISGSQDNTVLIWDSYTHELIKGPLTGHTGPVTSVAYSSDGSYIVSGSWDSTIIIWDPKTGSTSQGPFKGHTEPVNTIACSPTRSHVISGSSDNMIQVWDLQTAKPISLKGHAGGISAVAYSPDGNHIISTGGDMTIRIWDSLTGALIHTPIIGHTSIILDIAYSPDGKYAASGSMDNTIRVWDTQTGILVDEPFESLTNFVQSITHSQDVESKLASRRDLMELGQAIPIKSFWDPHSKDFMSTQLEQARITYPHQDASNNLDQERKTIKVTHSSHPLAIPSDGWLQTVDGGLLTHVPHEHQSSVCDMSVMCIPDDAEGHPLRLDWNEVYNAWDNIRKMLD